MRNSIRLVTALAVCGLPRVMMSQPPMHLTLAQAQQLAIQNNPHFTAARYNASAAYQTAPQYRAAYEPTIFGSFTGVGADNGSRLAAGGLNNPSCTTASGRASRSDRWSPISAGRAT